MMAKRLTSVAIENIKPSAQRREVPDPGARGLYVVVQPSGRKSFAVRYRYGGKPQKLTLNRGMTLAGRNPNAIKREAKRAQAAADAGTFRAIAEDYQKREGHRLRTARWRSAVLDRFVFPALGAVPIANIRRSDIVSLLDRIEAGEIVKADGRRLKGGPVMADRTLALISKILNWHALRDDDFRSPVVRGMARTSIRARARSRILTDDELRAVWRASEGDNVFAALVRFLLVTSARRSEAAAMTWSEIDDSDWTLPHTRNKTGLDLVRPLTAAALAVIESRPRIAGCDYIFTSDGRRPFTNFAAEKKRFDKSCGVCGWTLHDCRRTARSLMSRAGVNTDHAERCLGHVISGIRGTYDRHQFHSEMSRAFEALAAQIERIVNPTPNVVAMSA
jgi:integrase